MQQLEEKSEKKCMRNSPAERKVSGERRRGGAPGTGSEIPLQLMEKRMVEQAVPLLYMEDHIGADLHTAACGGDYAEAGGCALKETSACGESSKEQVFWQELQPLKHPLLVQSVPE